MKASKYIVSLMLLLLFATLTTAKDAVSYRRQSSVAGLSNYFVLSMAIDGEGYLWIGTESGLNRIVGRTVTTYKREQLGTPNDKILSLYYDAPTDRIYIGTERGLQIFDQRRNTFGTPLKGDKLETYSLNGIASDNSDGVWLLYGRGKVQHLDSKSNTVKTTHTGLPDIRCGMDDGNGQLYLGHGKAGMSIVSTKNGKTVTHLEHIEGDQRSLPGNNVRCIRKDHEGRIWVGTDRGLALYDPVTETFDLISHSHSASTLRDNVFDIQEMADGRLWVASDAGGISIVDVSTLAYDDAVTVELTSLNTRCLLQDKYGNIWVGNYSTGIDFIPSIPPLLHTLDYYDTHNRPKPTYGVASDSEGRIWVSSYDELSMWMDEGDATHTIRQHGSWKVTGMRHRAHSFARSVMADSHGYVWLGMEDEGVIRFDTRSHHFENIDIGYSPCDIHSFLDDGGKVWIGTQYGVCIYEGGTVTHAKDIDQATGGAPVTSFIRISDNELLMSTQGHGVVVFDTQTKKSRHTTMAEGLPSNNINQAVADRRQGIWLATHEGIIYLPDPHNLKSFKLFGQKEGLSDHQVRAIMQDKIGRIWASTYTEIVCLDTSTKQFHHYGQQDTGIGGGFMEGSSAKSSNGSIVFGSPNGLCYFYPESMTTASKVSEAQIALIEVFSPTAEGNDTLLLMSDHKGKFYVDYQQNTIRITYTVGNYAQAGEVEYSYMMKGLTNKWYYNGSDHDVMFRNLPPGDYTFVLRAKLKSQNWDDATTTQISIYISPPFWKTWWAYLLYAMLILGAIYWLFAQYKRRLALRNSLEMERRDSMHKQELNEERLRFFTNITHELRTPLTLILGPLEDLTLDKQMADNSRKKVEMINKNAQRLRDLINDILEFRKTETHNRRLSVAKGNLGQFVREIVLNYKELNRNPKVRIESHIGSNLPNVYFDSEVVSTVLGNLLSNAVKYTDQGSITVDVDTDTGGMMHISVSDTGYGISKDALPQVFDRYYQAEGSHQASGTGIGLSIVKSLAELHEATLHVESEEGKGSRFTFSIAVDNTYPNALHKEDTPTSKNDKSPEEAYDTEDTSMQLLIVEDNDDIRQYIADSLADDFKILQAANGEEGLRMALEHIPDIIVSDIMMPKLNGIELTQQLKEDIRTSHIPIILLTAKDTQEDKEEGYDSGADSYLTKPFTAKLLTSRIRNILANRRRLAERITDHMPTAEHQKKEEEAAQQLGQLDRDFISRLNDIIDENIMQTDIDMAFLTEKMAMSHSTFYRKVKALTCMTAKEYVRKRKLQHCYNLIASANYNVNQAAMMTGFNQMAHFREVFKKEFGILPSEVRRKQNLK